MTNTPARPVITSDDEEGWTTVTTEPNEFDPGAEAAAIPFLPVQSGRLQRMEKRDRERAEAIEKDRELRRSTRPIDRLEVHMRDRIWREVAYDEPLDADEVVDDVLAWLRKEKVLAEVWEDGFGAGYDYVSACCGCSGRGPEPANPYEDNHPRVEVRAWGRNNTVRIYRGL